VLGLALAILVGLSLGLLGGGGSILTVPILVYAVGLEPKAAVAASLAVVGTTSLLGALAHRRAGNVRLRTAAVFGGVAMVGAFAGARLAALISGQVQLVLFALVVLVASVVMLRGRGALESADRGDLAREPRLVPMALLAAAVGVMTGLVGVGGGFLIVPALVLVGRIPMKAAVGTSLLVIAMNSASGFLGYAGQVALPWGFLAQFTGVAVLGVAVGTALARAAPPTALRRGFAALLLVVGLLVLYQNRGLVLWT
jgi:uncharacterized membrane protein YfcA